MEVEATAPDAAQPLDGTAPAAPPPTTAPAATPDKPVPNDAALLRAEYTRVSQKWAEAARAAGLDPKSATPDDIVAALRPAEQGAPMDPRAAQAIADAEEKGWRYTGMAYPGIADGAREFADLVRSGERDPEALTQLLYTLVERYKGEPAAAQTNVAAAPVTPEPLPLGDADRAPTPPSNAAPSRPESATQSAIRRLLGQQPV